MWRFPASSIPAMNDDMNTTRLPATGIHRILVCRPNHRLGNMLLITPLLAEIETVFPGAEVDVLLGGMAGAELLVGYPRVQRIFCVMNRPGWHLWRLFSIIRKLRAARYDLAIDTANGSRSGRWLVAAARGRYTISATTLQDSDALQPQHHAQMPVHALRRTLSDGSPRLAEPYAPMSIRLSAAESATAAQALQRMTANVATAESVLVGVFLNATGRKCYPAAWWKTLLDRLQTLHPEYVFVEILPAHGQSMADDRYPGFYSNSPRKMAAMISRFACFITGDCGVMHLAAASGATTIGLFSVTDAIRYAPYGNHSCAINTQGIEPATLADRIDQLIQRKLAQG